MVMKILFSIILGTVFLLSVTTHSVSAWGPGWEGDQGCCSGPSLETQSYGEQSYGVSGCGGYCAGEKDAAYDVDNHLQYQPQGQCLPCHSDDYWSNFKQGYDSYWNSHQEQQQTQTQGSSVNINGNNNYVSVNQNQNQQQNPLQHLARAACDLLNCNQQQQQQPQGYQHADYSNDNQGPQY